MNLASLLGIGGPMSGIGLTGNPMSGIGVVGGMTGGQGAQGAQAAGAVPGAVEEEEKRKKKEGIAGMLKGMGKGTDQGTLRRSDPGIHSFDVQGLLASLFGG